MSEQRFIELEIKLAYQEDLLQTLNHIVITQQTELAQLKALYKQLAQRLKSLSLPDDMSEADQTPPHY